MWKKQKGLLKNLINLFLKNLFGSSSKISSMLALILGSLSLGLLLTISTHFLMLSSSCANTFKNPDMLQRVKRLEISEKPWFKSLRLDCDTRDLTRAIWYVTITNDGILIDVKKKLSQVTGVSLNSRVTGFCFLSIQNFLTASQRVKFTYQNLWKHQVKRKQLNLSN